MSPDQRKQMLLLFCCMKSYVAFTARLIILELIHWQSTQVSEVYRPNKRIQFLNSQEVQKGQCCCLFWCFSCCCWILAGHFIGLSLISNTHVIGLQGHVACHSYPWLGICQVDKCWKTNCTIQWRSDELHDSSDIRFHAQMVPLQPLLEKDNIKK